MSHVFHSKIILRQCLEDLLVLGLTAFSFDSFNLKQGGIWKTPKHRDRAEFHVHVIPY